MFIGHYGVSLALKWANPHLSPCGLFLAVQGLELLFFTFVLTATVAVILVALCVATPFMPPPSGVVSGAIQGLLAYVVLAVLAVWLERARSARGAIGLRDTT